MNKTALVTGGTRGIGRAVAEQLIADGYEVVVTSRSTKVGPQATEWGARGLRLDVADVDSVAALGDHLTAVDVLVNNAGAFAAPTPAPGAPLSDVAAAWRHNLDVNLVGAALLVTALEDRLRAGGSVVSIGSIGAEYAGNPYSVAKAALQAWNVGLAERLGPRDITANVVSPGYTEGTDLFGGPLPEARHTRLVERTTLGRPGRPADIAGAVAFLASAQARQITGQTIHVNGGAYTTR
ncbi:SDR family NAD(P)-dependent oxidoreductase [Ruania zhangjianzhongii]|uniref:SDR family NAD(P)-dependent oxidoreductase n=1 Tax=Ruania zhangjianzhongii TaxID=2603206 RepID=UPI0011CA6800|nr:SDR family oxidoreductase [Ruania zhangjianzhongii]